MSVILALLACLNSNGLECQLPEPASELSVELFDEPKWDSAKVIDRKGRVVRNIASVEVWPLADGRAIVTLHLDYLDDTLPIVLDNGKEIFLKADLRRELVLTNENEVIGALGWQWNPGNYPGGDFKVTGFFPVRPPQTGLPYSRKVYEKKWERK